MILGLTTLAVLPLGSAPVVSAPPPAGVVANPMFGGGAAINPIWGMMA